MNLSESISKEIKKLLPVYIKLDDVSKIADVNIINMNIEYTNKQKEKQNLILEIKKEATKGKSARSITKEYNIDKRTVSKYIKVVNVEKASIYDTSNRGFSYLDSCREEIIALYSSNSNASYVYRILKERGINLTYSNLRYYI